MRFRIVTAKQGIILLIVVSLILVYLWQVKVRVSNVIIEIHDVSPLNGVEVSKYIAKKYSKFNTTIYLFVILNHGYVADISKDKEFMSNLRELENAANLCVHGYSHSDEDFSNVPFAKNRIELIDSFLRNTTLNFSDCFSPPFWRYSQQSVDILASHFDTVFLKNSIIYKGRMKHTITIQAPLRNSEILWLLTLFYAKCKIAFGDGDIVRIVFHEKNDINLVDFFLKNLIES